MSSSTLETRRDRGFAVFVAVVSVAALSFLAWLLVLRTAEPGGQDLRFLPAVNASLNATSALLLALGFFFVRQKKIKQHQICMVGAFASSAVFLVSYIAYHYAHGDTKFMGEGAIRTVYFVVLISHIVLSVPIVPGALFSFWFAGTKRFAPHRKLNRVLLPIWLYVSVTGVVIFFLLRTWGQPAA
jgi:putative membrane protein